MTSMDSAVYWLGAVAKILLFLVLIRVCLWGVVWVVERVWGVRVGVGGWRLMGFDSLSLRSTTYELEVIRFFVTIRWFDSSCRRFFKVNISRLHVECVLSPPGSSALSRTVPVRPAPPPHTKASLRQRFLFWFLRFTAKHVELCVSKLEVTVHDMVDREVEFLGVVMVREGVSLLAQPMPEKMLAVSVEVESAKAQLLMLSEKCPVSQLEEGYSPLLEVEGSSRVYFYLQPLASPSLPTLASLQINTAPLSCTLLREGAFRYAVQHVGSYLPPRRPTGNSSTSSPSKTLEDRVTKFPKVEVVLEDVSLLHQVRETNRVVSSKLSRVCLNFGACAASAGVSGHPGLSAMVGLQDLTATDSLSREFLKLKQFRVNSKYDGGQLSNVVKVESLHSTLREDETVFWTKYLLSSLRSFWRGNNQQQTSVGSSSSPRRGGVPDVLGLMMSSAVTTVEASDWSVSMRMDTPTLQSKEPLVQAVLASCAANLQWARPDSTHSHPIVRASLRLEDSYLHVPGHTSSPSSEDSSLFRQRPDDPSVLPSLRRHQWGHLLALGNLTLKIEKTVSADLLPRPSGVGERQGVEGEAVETLSSNSRGRESSESERVTKFRLGWSWEEVCSVLVGGEPACVTGEGSSLMVEWSTPTEVALLRTLQHLKQRYHLFGGTAAGQQAAKEGQSRLVSSPRPAQEAGENERESVKKGTDVESASGSTTEEGATFTGSVLGQLALSFRFNDANAFIYGLSPRPPAVMLRLDAVSLSTFQPSPSPPTPSPPSPSPSFQVNLHGLLLDSLSSESSLSSSFLCSPLASLPAGVGLGVVNSLNLKYQHSLKEISVSVSRVETNWSPTCHRSLFHVTSSIWNGVRDLAAIVGLQLPARQEVNQQPQVVLVGEKMSEIVSGLPLSLAINLETAVCHASVGQSSSVSLVVQTSHCLVKDRSLAADAYELGIAFDGHRIVTVENLKAVFPRLDRDGEIERRKMKQIQLETNPAIDLSATRTKVIFPYGYKFGSTFDKVMTVRKYLGQLHGTGATSAPSLSLPPDIHLQCGEVVMQLCEDPFEAKLRANYELMCDEYDQKLDRLKALDKKVEELKLKQGEFSLSAKKLQSLYDGLVVKSCQIYCRRAQELHSSPGACRDELFVFSLDRLKLWAMFDPSMLGRDRLVDHIQNMDDISPFPEEKYDFSTLWGMYISGDTEKLQVQLRDYHHPLLQGTNWRASGRMVFAEQEAQEREMRSAVVELGQPWQSASVQRKLPPLKYYYDLEMDSSTFVWSHGPCLEPALAQTSIAFGLLSNPTVDPSRPLAYWDRFRLLFHGRIHFFTKEATILLPATFDPYNTVSYIEIILKNLHTNLTTNKQLELEGSLQAYVHNVTKYDDCELANFPHVRTSLSCHWVCVSRDPHNHHAVRRCAPDKIPVLPDKLEHDSYSAFRSQNVDVDWTLQALPQKDTDPNPPSLLLFFSTLRWLQQYQVLLSVNVSRPIRKGSRWKVARKRHRPPLLRHWRNLKIDVTFPRSVLTLWTSVAKQQGMECIIESGSLGVAYLIELTPFTDGLIRRQNRTWKVVSFSGNVKDLIVYVEKKDRLPKGQEEEKEEETPDLLIANAHAHDAEPEEEVGREGEREESTRSILGYTAELSYKHQEESDENESESESFTHKLSMLNTRVLVTASNKQVVLGLYDSYKQAQMLKRDLSAEALRSLVTVVEPPLDPNTSTAGEESGGSPEAGSTPSSSGSGSRPSSARRVHRHSSSGNVMLDQLLKDLGNRLTVAEDTSSTKAPLKGVQLASGEDVRHKNWLITLTNIQVALRGIETSGYVVASSNKAQIFGQEHQPVLKEGDLVAKKSWLTCVDKLQYFSTFGSMFEGGCVPWLPLSVISSPSPMKQSAPSKSTVPRDLESSLNALLSQLGPARADEGGEEETKGSGIQPSSREATVGSLVNCLLIPAEQDTGRQELRGGAIQGASLQRIASRCQCNVIYVSYGGQAEPEACDPTLLTPEAASPGLTGNRSEAVDTITVTYPTVKICTTSEQQALIMDIITNLVLHKEPGKKEVLDQRAHMQFVMQLSDIQDPRKPVLVQQNKVRRCLQTIRSLEREVYFTQRQRETREGAEEERLEQELVELEAGLQVAKEDLSVATMNLRAMIRAFKESRLLPQPGQFAGVPEPVQRIEIWLDDAHWWLTQKDGQLEIADISIANFSYNRVWFSDDSGEHRLELGSFLVHNLTPNTPPIYQEVLVPYDPKSRRLRVDKNICLRVYCRDKASVAGITVREHLEVNVVPLQVSLTAKFYQAMQDFFFPKTEGDGPDPLEPDHSHLFGVHPTQSFGADVTDGFFLQRGSSSRRSTVSLTSSASHGSLQHAQQAGYSPPASPSPRELQSRRGGKHLSLSHLDTVKKMKERASHINAFIYVKIPQTTLCITYKGENWSYKDLQNQVMNMPTLEYHNRNWTWKDMLMEVKKDYKNAIIHQTFKSAIGMKESDESSGLASPKLRRDSDLLFKVNKNSKAGKGKKLFGKLSSMKEDSDSDKESSPGSASPVHFPPLREQETNLKKTYQRLTKLSQEAQK